MSADATGEPTSDSTLIMTSDLRAATWRCIHFTSREETVELSAGITPSGLFIARIPVASQANKTNLLMGLRLAIRCPGYVAGNWDVLDEALRDLEWLAATGYVLIVEEASRLWAEATREAGTLVEIWLAAAESWSHDGKPFHLLFEMS